ncbi:MAG: ArsI/CadI family heavy metal resistance metalloenzyme [Myxococcota bacterium]|nr:ArsI/CadI family heavy metal resistance metalloenzyme [Myxococcota bacterium]
MSRLHTDRPEGSVRFQLALNVRDLEEAVAWYTKLLGVGPAKRQPGYANFACDDPPLKLVLFEAPEASERLNHVGFELADEAGVERAIARLEAAGVAEVVDRDERCCYAKKRTVWAHEPEGLRWEFYRKEADLEAFAGGAEEPAQPSAPPAPTPASAGTATPTGCCGLG